MTAPGPAAGRPLRAPGRDTARRASPAPARAAAGHPPSGRKRPATEPSPTIRRRQPFYSRLLRLRYIRPGGVLGFLFLEGAVLVAVLLALAELVSWWAVPALPAAVALVVKLHDVVAGGTALDVTGNVGPVERDPGAAPVEEEPLVVRAARRSTARRFGMP